MPAPQWAPSDFGRSNLCPAGDSVSPKLSVSSFQGRENKGSPKKRVDARLSRMPSLEQGKDREQGWSPDGAAESKQESEENKENLLGRPELRDEDLLLYQDPEVLDDSIISGEQSRGLEYAGWGLGMHQRGAKMGT